MFFFYCFPLLAHSLRFVFACYQNHVCECARVCCEVLEGHKGHRGAQERANATAATVKRDHGAVRCACPRERRWKLIGRRSRKHDVNIQTDW